MHHLSLFQIECHSLRTFFYIMTGKFHKVNLPKCYENVSISDRIMDLDPIPST